MGRGLQFSGVRISLLLFAHDVVLMVPLACHLQHSLDQLSAECKTAGMRISTPKSKVKALRKLTGCLLSFAPRGKV